MPGEDAALVAEDERLSNADALYAAAAAAHEALAGDPASSSMDASDVLTLLGLAGRALDPVRSHDPALAGLAGRLSEAAYLLSDVAADLASYTESLDSDPARLAAVQERRATVGRWSGPTAAPPRTSRGSWTGLSRPEHGSASSRATPTRSRPWPRQEAELATQVGSLAADLTALRAAAAERFATEVTAELTDLAMPHASLSALLIELDEPGPHGADDVEIRLAAHPGAPPLPLHKGASGGELSRVMLAIEVVFAGVVPGTHVRVR